MPTYPGGKAAVYQQIINRMPPHRVYIETHIGAGGVWRHKRPAQLNIGIDIDPAVIRQWELSPNAPVEASRPGTGDVAGDRAENDDGRRQAPPHQARSNPRSRIAISGDPTRSEPRAEPATINDAAGLAAARAKNGDAGSTLFLTMDAVKFLKVYRFTGAELVYCDPPYLMSTRSGRRLYRHEMTDDAHRQLLKEIKRLPCPVIISGYESDLYREQLKGWTTATFQAMTRGGRPATEWLWFNFPEPAELHDYRYLGENYREREVIKRQKQRWTARLNRMPLIRKRAMFAAIASIAESGDAGHLTT